MSEQQYWSNVYRTTDMPTNPSLFALFIQNELGDKINTVIDVGCGNGRDSYFLAKSNTVLGIDIANKPEDKETASFALGSMDDLKGQHDLLYSRFSLHSVKVGVEDALLDYALNNCKYIAIEARSTKDQLNKGGNRLSHDENENKTSYADKHYRRFLHFEEFCKKISSRGFKILHASESDTYAPYKDYNPFCLRIIATTN
jgi:predicted TPR repeat methyltransferase